MLPLVLAISFLSPVGACADLSGRYVHAGEDNEVYVSIVLNPIRRFPTLLEHSIAGSRTACLSCSCEFLQVHGID